MTTQAGQPLVYQSFSHKVSHKASMRPLRVVSHTLQKDEKGGGKDGGKPKKPPPTPVQQAWLTFLADMDDKINKQKRYFLEDLYRGVAMLTQRERAQLEAAVMTTTNKVRGCTHTHTHAHTRECMLLQESLGSKSLRSTGPCNATACRLR